MSWNYSLTCDECSSQTNEEKTRALVLQRAREAGWALRGARGLHGVIRGHFCPDCVMSRPAAPQCPSCRRRMTLAGDSAASCATTGCRHHGRAYAVRLNTADNAYQFADDEDCPLTRREERLAEERDRASSRIAQEEE